MGVKCQIILRKTEDGIFRAGEAVVGIVKYFVDKPTKIESIDISLVGKGKSQWVNHSESSDEYCFNKEEYVNIFKNILIARDCHHTLSGTYKHPFEFLLPDDIPTSFKNKLCTIKYKVIVTFVKKNVLDTVRRFEEEIPVYGYVSPCSPEPLIFGLQKNLLLMSPNNKINVIAKIDKTFLTPGENITLRLTIRNKSEVPVTIKTDLVKYFTYISEGGKKKIDREYVKTITGLTPSIKKKSVSKLTCIVPTLPNLYSIQHSKVLIGEFKVKVTAKVPFPHINAEVEIPVVIGERRGLLGAKLVGYGEPFSSERHKEE